MNRHRSANDPAAERLADRLMAEADAEEWDFFVGADEIDDASGARRCSRAGRDDDRLRLFRKQFLRIERVIADDAHRAAGKPLDLLD
jgi:hypothetical protein